MLVKHNDMECSGKFECLVVVSNALVESSSFSRNFPSYHYGLFEITNESVSAIASLLPLPSQQRWNQMNKMLKERKIWINYKEKLKKSERVVVKVRYNKGFVNFFYSAKAQPPPPSSVATTATSHSIHSSSSAADAGALSLSNKSVYRSSLPSSRLPFFCFALPDSSQTLPFFPFTATSFYNNSDEDQRYHQHQQHQQHHNVHSQQQQQQHQQQRRHHETIQSPMEEEPTSEEKEEKEEEEEDEWPTFMNEISEEELIQRMKEIEEKKRKMTVLKEVYEMIAEELEEEEKKFAQFNELEATASQE